MKNILFAVLWFVAFGGIFGFVLAYLSKKLAVKTDPRREKLLSCLPGANCGGCGYAGCAALADAVLSGEEKPSRCGGLGEEELAQICSLLGLEAERKVKMRAVVRCSGGDCAKDKYHYEGVSDCRIAARLAGGNKFCRNGCVGLGNCTKKCAFDALHIADGRAVVDEKKCRGCSACVSACPKGLIELVPFDAQFVVHCASSENAKTVMKICEKGCIGCKRCEKACENGAIHVDGSLAVIDYELCTHCGKCSEVCPRGVIRKEKN